MHLNIRNDSVRKGLYRRDGLLRLARRVCEGEGYGRDAELSLLFCDDAFITDLNRRYRKKNQSTDVLSFGQPQDAPTIPGQDPVLGDIAISLETVEQRCGGAPRLMRDEVRLLFCHGLLHLLGCHHNTARERQRMAIKQSQYLGISVEAAWSDRPGPPHSAARR